MNQLNPYLNDPKYFGESCESIAWQKGYEQAKSEYTKKLSWYESGNIHTCNYQCERPLCVQRRRINDLEKEVEQLCEEIELLDYTKTASNEGRHE